LAIGIQSGVALSKARAALLPPYPEGSYVNYLGYPNLYCISTSIIDGTSVPVNCTNDVSAPGSSQTFLIDAEFLVSLPGFSDACVAGCVQGWCRKFEETAIQARG
jgi:hypothetical protein